MRRKVDSAVISAACLTAAIWLIAIAVMGQGSPAGWIVGIALVVVALVFTAALRLLIRDARLEAQLQARGPGYRYGDDACSCGMFRADECQCFRGEGR